MAKNIELSKFVFNHGYFVDPEPVEGTKNIYPYATFPSMFRGIVGLLKTAGGPKDEILDYVSYYETEINADAGGIAPLTEFGNAFEEIGKRYFFEEYPMVEVSDEEEYNEVLIAKGLLLEDTAWEKPGVYDFRDQPPTFVNTVEQYELDSMEYEAENLIDFMFQGDEWKDLIKKLTEEEPEVEDKPLTPFFIRK